MGSPSTPQLADTPEAATPEAVEILSSVPGIATVVRDADHKVIRCNAEYASNTGLDRGELNGTTHRDINPGPAADERTKLMREVIEQNTPRDFLQFWNGRAWLCRIIPLDEDAYETKGTLSVIMQAPIGTRLADSKSIHTLETADFGVLEALTPAEKRTIYDLAKGRSNGEIAELQDRSVRTIECHVRAIHEKLGTSSRSAIVRDASERGIQIFSQETWERMIGANKSTGRGSGAATRAKRSAAADRAAVVEPKG